MKIGNHDLGGGNLILYEGGAFDIRIATLIKRGTLDDCLPPEEPTGRIVLLLNSPAAKKYGLGYLKEGEAYAPGKTVFLDRIEAIAGYGTMLAWEHFIRKVKMK